jgi:hypothetical protein
MSAILEKGIVPSLAIGPDCRAKLLKGIGYLN